MLNFKKLAFTLAEVLITLGIIGIVAAITIPTLIQQQQEQATVVALKKIYSTLSQAYTSAAHENGTPDNWGLTNDTAGSIKLINILTQYLKATKTCIDGDYTGCFPNVNYKDLANGDAGNLNTVQRGKAILTDGTLIIPQFHSITCGSNRGSTPALSTVCASLFVDINGFKNPNQLGVDYFRFYLTKNGIIPGGSVNETFIPFDPDCKNKTGGYGCTAWIIYNENLDYLHCSDLTWDGKHKCSN